MSKIHCDACGYIVDEFAEKLTLLVDVQKWIIYVLSLHLKHGETATHLNKLKELPTLPWVQSHRQMGQRQFLILNRQLLVGDGMSQCLGRLAQLASSHLHRRGRFVGR